MWMFLCVIYLPGLLARTRPPSIHTQPDDYVYYNVGETVRLPCVADGEPQPKYTWTRNGLEFYPRGNDYRMVQLPYVGTIVINRPEERDEGIYQCFADNGYGKSATININLLEAKLDSFAITNSITHSPNLGDPLTLDCVLPRSVPGPQFYWAINRNGNNVAINYDARITVDHEARLRITNVKAEDSQDGRAYTCIALNKVARQVVSGGSNFIRPRGTVETLYNVTYMWTSPSDDYGLRGDEFKLKCIFSGNPTPVVHWKRISGGPMPPGVKMASFGQELIFPHLEYSDAGEYECVANNSISQTPVRSSVDLRVESRPYWVDGGPRDAEVAIGESANFSCKASGVPEPDIKWFINSVRLSRVTDPRIVNGKFQVLTSDTVQIVNVTGADAMVIQCNVTNRHGYVWGESYLIAYSEPPTIIRPPEANQVTAEGLSVNVSCLTTGKPDPQITWFIDGQQITDGRYVIQPNGDLLIQNVTLSDTGNYTCVAESRLGKETASGMLSVKLKTSIEQGPLDLEVNAGHEATFTCSATTDPDEAHNLTILWERNNKIITSYDLRMVISGYHNSLTVRPTIVRDSGMYTCIATNGIDSARKSAILVVKDKPDPPFNVQIEKCEVNNAIISFTPGRENNSPIEYFVIQYNTSFEQDQWNFGARSEVNQTQVMVPLSPYANFTYRVIAYNKIGGSDPSFPSRTRCTTAPALPSKNPEDLRTIGNKKKYLTIQWTPMQRIEQNGPGFQYVLQMKKQGDPDQNTNSITIDDWKIDRYEMSTGDIYQPYEITLKARNGQGEAGGAKTIIGFSGEDLPTVYPTNLTAEMIKSTEATMSWDFDMSTINPTGTTNTPLNGEFKGFKIQYWKENYKIETYTEWDISADDALKNAVGNKVTALVKRLPPFSNLEAIVSVTNNFYVSAPSNILKFQTKPGVPGSVRHFEARNISYDHFVLEWVEPSDKNGNLTGYYIGYQTVKGLKLGTMMFLRPQINDPLQNSTILDGLLPKTKYRIKIWARTAQGRGEVYFIERATTAFVPMYTIESVGTDYIKVTWSSDVYYKPGGVVFVEYRKLGAPNWINSTDEDVNTWKNITNLESSTTYEIRVVVVYETMRSESNITDVTTTEPVPIYTIESVGKDYINVTWSSNGINKPGILKFIEYRKLGDSEWMNSSVDHKDIMTTIPDLQPGVTYELRAVVIYKTQRTESNITQFVTMADSKVHISHPVSNIEWILGFLAAVVAVLLIIAVVYCYCKRADKKTKYSKDTSGASPKAYYHTNTYSSDKEGQCFVDVNSPEKS
ncbi:hypothetical protein SNE40_015257 [Patella caerulea]|uniref:Neuroglian n=1 Tax=Patella caerulea TaxID=87958 RepID=A0AAN8JLU5_PATCE